MGTKRELVTLTEDEWHLICAYLGATVQATCPASMGLINKLVEAKIFIDIKDRKYRVVSPGVIKLANNR